MAKSNRDRGGIIGRLPVALLLSIVLILVSVPGSGAFAAAPAANTAAGATIYIIPDSGTEDGTHYKWTNIAAAVSALTDGDTLDISGAGNPASSATIDLLALDDIKVLGDSGTVYYVKIVSAHDLIIENLLLKGDMANGSLRMTGADVTLTVNGACSIINTAINFGWCIFYTNMTSTASLTIDGSGTLEADATTDGIYCMGNLTFSGGGTADVRGGSSGIIMATNSRVLTVNSTVAASVKGSEIANGGITFMGNNASLRGSGSLTTGATGANGSGIAVNSDNLVITNTGTLNITGAGSGAGIYARVNTDQAIVFNRTATTTITGGAIGSAINKEFSGALTTNNSGTGVLNLNSGAYGGRGIYCRENLTLAGSGAINATGASQGIYIDVANQSLTLDGTVAVTATGAQNSAGLHISGTGRVNLTDPGQKLTVNNRNTSALAIPLTKPAGDEFTWNITDGALTDGTLTGDVTDQNVTYTLAAGNVTPRTATIKLTATDSGGTGGDDNVCAIGATGYATFKAAVDVATSGQIITLLQNCTETQPIVVNGKTVNLVTGAYTLNLDTSAIANSTALTVENGGKLLQATGDTGKFNIKGGNLYGVFVEDANSEVAIIGDITGDGSGAFVWSGAKATITGNVTGTGNFSSANGVFASGSGTIVNLIGNATGVPYGVSALNGAKITVTGNTTSHQNAINNSGNSGVYASDPGTEVTVTGNTTGVEYGVQSGPGAKVTIDGTVSGAVYIKIFNLELTAADITLPTTKQGYNTYTDGTSTVWVKVGDPIDTTPPAPASASECQELTDGVSAAEAAKAGVVVSADGKDVPIGTSWVTKQVLDELNAAIAAAQSVIGDPGSTSAQVQAAKDALAAAVAKFNAAKQAGAEDTKVTQPPTDDKTVKPTLPKTKIKKIAVAKKSVKLTFVKVNKKLKVTRYQIQYRIKGVKKWKSKNVKVKYTGKTTAKVTIKKLKAGKRYQFKIRAWQAIGKTKYYAKWSPIKTSGKVKG